MNSDLKFVIIGHLNNELLNIVPKNMKIIRSEANQPILQFLLRT